MKVSGHHDGPTVDEVEVLLSGQGSHDITVFLDGLRTLREPALDDGFVASRLATKALKSRTGRTARVRRLAAISISGALVVAFAGSALASDDAVPGDLMYPIDRSLEELGLNDGGIDERLDEYDSLIASNDLSSADEFIASVLESADELETERAIHHLTLAEQKTNPNATATQVKVAELQEFITNNQAPGVGVDGREFGRGISEIAKSKKPPNLQREDGPTQGRPQQAGPKKDR